MQQDKICNPPKNHSYYAKFWLKEKNEAFAADVEVAVRGAMFVTVLALPFMLPFKMEPVAGEAVAAEFDPYHMIRKGWFQTYSISCFMFAYWKDLGTTINLALSGTFGVWLAVLGSWILFGFFPDSVTPEMVANPTSPIALFTYGFAFVYGAGFLFLCAWLNLNLNAVIFAAASFVWFLMEFLKPQTNHFAVGFEIDLKGYATKQFVASVGGSLLAVLCMMFPYSITAYQRAENNTRKACDILISSWFELCAHVCSPEVNDFRLNAIERDLNQLKSGVYSIDGDLDTSWWECLGLGAMQQKRIILRRYESRLIKAYERVTAAYYIAIRKQSFSGAETQKAKKIQAIMSPLQDSMEALVREAQDLFYFGLKALDTKGGIDSQKDQLRQNSAELRTEIENFTNAFRRAKEAQGCQSIDPDLLEESAFCLTLCAFGRSCADWADEMANDPKHVEEGGFLGLGSLKTIVDRKIIMDPENIRASLRVWVQLMVCFGLGFAMHWPSTYNAGIASNAAVLLSKRPGAALERNMARMQGAVLGLASGGLIYMLSDSVFGSCTPGNYISLSIGLFLWLAVTLFLYNNSTVNCGLGFLLAYFGMGPFLKGCGNAGDSGGFRNMVVGLIFTVWVMLIVDQLFQQEVASQVAYRKIVTCLDAIGSSLRKTFDTNEETITFAGTVPASLADAQTWGALAAAEPRFEKTPWRASIFQSTTDSVSKVRFILYGLKQTMAGVDPNGLKTREMRMVTDVEAFKDFADTPLTKLSQCKDLMKILLNEEEEMPEDIEIAKSVASRTLSLSVDATVKALNLESIFATPSKTATLEDDFSCQISYILLALNGIMEQNRAITASVIEKA